jgi:cytochrome c
MRQLTGLPLLGTLALLAAAAAAQQAASGDAEHGKTLYYEHGCYACHGYQGIGRRNLVNGVSGVLASEQVFLTYLRARADLNPMLPVQTMPNYPATSLPDDDALDIYAYVTTFRDDPPEVDDIPALKAILEAAENGQ